MKELIELSSLIKRINDANEDIAELIGRPAKLEGMGEAIAAGILKLRLNDAAPHLPRTGVFTEGPLSGKSVVINWYLRFFNHVDFSDDVDCYLFLVGCHKFYQTPHEYYRPILINSVYIFKRETVDGIIDLNDWTTSMQVPVRIRDWDKAEIFPESNSPILELTDEQKEMFRLFCG